MKMKNRSHRYDINSPRSRNELKYSKYKKYLTMMMLYVLRIHAHEVMFLICKSIYILKVYSIHYTLR